MTILFEAWRRAHDKNPRLAETLGAPAGGGLHRRRPLLPWLLLLLVACAAGLGVYIGLVWGARHETVAKTSPPAVSRPLVVSRAAAPRRHAARTAPASRRTSAIGAVVSTSTQVASPAIAAEPPSAKPVHKTASSTVASPPVQHSSAGSAVASSRVQHSVPIVHRAPPAATLELAAVPDNVREALPSLAVIAHVWNTNPAASFIMIGERVYRVGDELAPGLRLLAITRSGEVVAFRGYRIALP